MYMGLENIGGIPLIGGPGVEQGGAGINMSSMIGYIVGRTPVEGETFPALLKDAEDRYLVYGTPESAHAAAAALMATGEVSDDQLIVFPIGLVVADTLMSKAVVVPKPPVS
jgi:alkanesulfonate monooxygenase SsuD/methylene tetrahydromethanopterin reductase-like flavin-dependent oxidoreductase (luciferase family)